jgi:hypothetical protein
MDGGHPLPARGLRFTGGAVEDPRRYRHELDGLVAKGDDPVADEASHRVPGPRHHGQVVDREAIGLHVRW